MVVRSLWNIEKESKQLKRLDRNQAAAKPKMKYASALFLLGLHINAIQHLLRLSGFLLLHNHIIIIIRFFRRPQNTQTFSRRF